MKKKILVLSLLFFVFLIALTPVSLLESQLTKLRGVSVSGLSGSVWSGNVAQVNVGKIYFSDIDYDNSVFSLLTATLSSDLKIKSGDIKGTLNIEVGTDYQEKVNLNNINLRMPASLIQNFTNTMGAEIGGNVSTNSLNLSLEKQKVKNVSGVARLRNASVSFAGQNIKLGDFAVSLSTDEKTGIIKGVLQKTKNALGLEGEVTLAPNGMLEFNGTISEDSEQMILMAASSFKNGNSQNGRMPIKFRQKITR